MMDLARHLAIPDRLVWTDLQIGPSGSPRPDVFTMQKSYSRPSPTAYECKISVSDFRADITEGKWQKYLKFAQSVTFCVPAGLVQKSDIPVGCGFMTRGVEGWFTARRATRQNVDLKADHLMKLLIDGYGHELGQRELKRRDMRAALAADKIAKKFGQEVATVIRDVGQAKRMVDHYEEQGRTRREKTEEECRRIYDAQQRVWGDLAEVLGLQPGAHRFDIEKAILNLKKPENIGSVNPLRESLQSISEIAGRALRRS